MAKARKRVVALGLIALMVTLNPTKVLAENPKVEYVKEFTMASGSSVEEAKKVLEKAGYRAKEEPINSSSSKVVLLGYKTTQKRNEAITDVKAMNENGEFSSTNLQKSLENQSKEIKKLVNQWKPAIEEFQENYGDGSKATVPAQVAKMAMDTLYEDDSKKLMGDFLLGLDFDKEKDVEAFTSVLMQGNSGGIATLQDALTTACAEVQVTDEGNGPCNWIERYCAFSMAKDFDDKYASDAATLHNQSESVKKRLNTYFKTMKRRDVGGTSKGYNAYIEMIKKENTSKAEKEAAELTLAKGVYDMLRGHKCRILRNEDGKTKALDMDMTDFFRRDDLSDADFYPMAKAMTKGQLSMLIYVGMEEMMVISGKTVTKWKNAKKSAKEKIDTTYEGENKKYISIYEGVNRKMFDQEMIKKGQIALTKSASEYCDLTGDYSWAAEGKGVSASTEKLYKLGTFISLVVAIGGIVPGVIFNEPAFRWVTYNMEIAGKVLFVIGIVALIACFVFIGLGMSGGDSEKQKPQMLVDESLLEGKTKDAAKIKGYVTYDAVTDPSGKILDCNGNAGKQWVCLYQTKYSLAGDPITTDFVVSDKLINNSKYKEVQKFGSQGAVNLSSYVNTEAEKYIYVQKKVLDFEGASSAGSVFAGGTNLIFGGIGVILGALGYGLLDTTRRKRKKLA